MTEPAEPLSRRERRAMEEAARAAEGEMTQALPVAPETLSTASRRERRRLERLANPVETWTEEEELIATGQMPAMTPEVLAEQDRLVEERAAKAEAEAAAQAYAETAPEAVDLPDAVAEVETFVPEPSVEFVPQAVASEPEPEAVAEEPEPEPEPDDGMSHIPADLRHLFPPGSLQARQFTKEPPPAAAPPVSSDAADEIRRLTHEAMAGITKATTGAVPEVHEAPEPEAVAVEPTPEAEAAPEPEAEAVVFEPTPADVPDLPEGVDVEDLWNTPTVDEPVRTSILSPAFPDVDPEPVALEDVPLVSDVPVPSQPGNAARPAVTPVWSALVPAQPAAQRHEFEPVSLAQQQPTPAPTMWDTHPLTHPGATPVRELPAEPAQQELPRPDLTALMGGQLGPSVGQAVYASNEPSTSTTSVPLRPAEPNAGGGARHFRWAHLAVIGAIAFVLGVLAWNIARSGS